MKNKYISVLTALLSVFCIQAVSAQQTQDALYIFRNDGGFNAFFFGDIDHIEYSKVDTLKVEHDDYVVQEVWAHDTVYRIPISAIDSVAFVTPETKYKADVFRPDKSIVGYIVDSDGVNWIRLASNTPTAMIPKAGAKLLIEEEGTYIPNGFVGLVTSVDKASNGYTVMTAELSPTDVYERLVVKAAGATPLSDKTRRRGLFDGTEMNFTTEEPIDMPALSGSISIQGSQVLYDNHDISLTADGSGSIGFSLIPRIQFRGFLFIDPALGIQYDQNVIFENKASWNLAFSGSLTGNADVPLYGLPEKKINALKLSVSCGLFINAQVTGLNVGATWENHHVGRDFFYNNIDDISANNYQAQCLPVHKQSVTFLSDTMTVDASVQGKYAFSAGVYAKAEVELKLPFNKKEINTKVGARLEVGGRLGFEAPVWSPDIAMDLLKTTSIYQLLNKETNISLSAYGKFSAYAQFNNWSWSVNPEASLATANLYGLVPDISSIRADYDDPERLYRIKFTSPIRRNVLVGIPTGFTVFDQDKKQIDDWGGGYFFREAAKKDYDYVFTTLDPVKDANKTYTVYPYIRFMNSQLLVDKSVDVTIDPARIDVEKRQLKVDGESGFCDIGVQPNMAKVEFTPTANWLTTSWIDTRNELTVFWTEMPKGMKGRKAKINIAGKNSKTDETIITDTISVLQGEPDGYANVDPTLLEFPAEGGALYYDVDWGDYQYLRRVASSYVVNTGLKSARGQDYTSEGRYGNNYYVTALPNTTDKAMSDTVFCYFTNDKESPLEERLCIPVVIKQAAGPYDLQGIRKLFLGSWIGISADQEWERRVSFAADGVYTVQNRYLNSKTGEWGEWGKPSTHTYSVQDVTTSSLYYKVSISLTGFSEGQFVEIYPHFMRHGGFYYEREDGSGNIWWRGRTRSVAPTEMKEEIFE